MQGLTDPPRQDLTPAQVRSIIEADSITAEAGLELVTAAGVIQQDVSDRLTDGTVEHDNYATIHGTCKLRTGLLPWGSARVRPWISLTDNYSGLEARFWEGVYLLETPVRIIGETPEEYDVEGYDPLAILNVEPLDTFTVATGANAVAAAEDILDDQGAGTPHQIVASSAVLSAPKVWQPGGSLTWLNIVNELLDYAGHRGLYADWTGRYRSEPYVVPSDRGVEWDYSADSRWRIVGENRKVTADFYNAPNKWKFIRNNPADGISDPGVGGVFEYTNQSDGPTSVDERGGRIIPFRMLVDVADDAALESFAQQRIERDKRLDTTIEYECGPNPLHAHADVVSYEDAAFGPTVKAAVHHWALPLNGNPGTLRVRGV